MNNLFAAMAAVTVVAGGFTFATATPADAQSRGAPRGSYAQTCTGAYINQGRLYADCRDERGRMRSTSIQVNRCSNSDIVNINGLLSCNNVRGDFEDNGRPNNGRPNDNNRPGGGWDNNRPGSGWNNGRNGSITVYRDVDFRGQTMTFDREVPNLRNYGMNDAITSIRLPRNSGSWEICTDANFRGRCEVVSSDVRDLTRMRLNDTISSIRPAGRYGRDDDRRPDYRPR